MTWTRTCLWLLSIQFTGQSTEPKLARNWFGFKESLNKWIPFMPFDRLGTVLSKDLSQNFLNLSTNPASPAESASPVR